jgi:hypothetical protein
LKKHALRVLNQHGKTKTATVKLTLFITEAERIALRRLYQSLCPLINVFIPDKKLPSKTTIGSKTVKKYDKPKTPYWCLLEPGLADGEKAYNKRLARRRVVIEYINGKIKVFKCMAYPYRGHGQNRHSLRMTLICGIINYDRLV